MDFLSHSFTLLLFIIGLVYILAGGILYTFPPKKINPYYGYRTATSMKSQSRWDFAQRYSAKLLLVLGIFILGASLLPLLIDITENESMLFGLLLLLSSVVFLLLKTERILKKTFPHE
ncbi:MAG TPA: SdpI family protein [Flavobacteriaceae bacterium]|nr:SdpI family protein [Flavobacteriaceae bacterium]